MADEKKEGKAEVGTTLFLHAPVKEAAEALGVPTEVLLALLVDQLGVRTDEDIALVSFQDLMDNVAGAKTIPVRRALDLLRGGKSSKGKTSDASTRDLVKDLRDEARLWQLTEGHPLLCEHGGAEHSAANIRHFKRTGTVPKVCVFAGCGTLLQHVKGEVSFEDGVTFLAADGLNPTTGRNEGRFPLADRALAFHLIQWRKLTIDEAWRRLEDGSLRTHFAVDAAELEASKPNYANELRKPFQGVRTGGADPFYREGGPGHRKY